MSDLPSIWRTELIHPLVVHFPIVLLMCGTLAWLAGQWVGRSSDQSSDQSSRWSFLLPAGRLMLAVGAVTAWAAVYTGDLADTEVARTLCDPTVVEAHEEYAFVVAAVFTGAILLDWAVVLVEKLQRWRTPLSLLIGIALLGASGLLGYVGHLGASLVYQQAAGVYRPSQMCTEFE
ncbi:hypothetical protein FIV42_07270 [Persicimonas caeni]|uniref:DUF2231 domain-containing protein n=1 Tax=Persicimonas caeni TaxID=2292766 RepID=A0A4Y6PQZ6_PERCE|nr:DUF2231 domain-containing protein [Persicimonas caeni]QDG50539.1 hypothetical protein FIV42_07270 [Persicimonas caeni]QED31760.1 hypothetical protein FRD00_07265 [Persicimonas caeni]